MLKRSPSPLGNCYSLELTRGVLAPLSWKNASPLDQGQARWVARGGLVPYQKEQGGEAYKLFLLTTASCSDAGKLKITSCNKLALFPLMFDAFRHLHVWLDNRILVHGGQLVVEVRRSIVEGFGFPSSFSPSFQVTTLRGIRREVHFHRGRGLMRQPGRQPLLCGVIRHEKPADRACHAQQRIYR